MSADPTGEPTTKTLGALATFRQTPTAAKALLAGVFVNRLAGFLLLFLVLFLTERGFSAGQAGLALGVYGAGGVLGTFVGGWLSDRLSARTTTLVSMVGYAVLLVAILYLESYPLILAAVLLLSIVGLLYRPAAQAMLTELVPHSQLVMVTAMYRLCLNLGTTAAPLLGVALVSISYDLLFWGEALAALLYGLIALRYLPKREPADEAAKADAAAERKKAPRASSGYMAVFRDVRYMFYVAAVLLVMLVYIQYTAALPLAIKEAGQSLWWYGVIVALNASVVVLLEVPLTRFTQAWPIRVVAFVGFGAIAVGYTVYAIGITPALLVLGTLIWTMNELIGGPTTFAWPGLVAPAHLRGRYYGAMQTAMGIGMTVGPIAGVWLWQWLGQVFFLWAAVAGLLSAVCAVIGMQRPTPPAETEAAVSPESTPEPAVAAEPLADDAVPKKEVHHGS
jgi:MFS family permease